MTGRVQRNRARAVGRRHSAINAPVLVDQHLSLR
jgi:hypothetical protein